MVRLFGNASILCCHKAVVIVRAKGRSHSKAISDLHALNCTDGHHSLRQISVQFFKNRLSDPGRHAPDNTFDHAACRILFLHLLLQQELCFLRCIKIRHVKRAFHDIIHGSLRFINVDPTDRPCICLHMNSKAFQQLLGDRSGSNSANRFSS